MLKVTVQQATSLPDVDSFGKSDPYAKVIFQGKFIHSFECMMSKCTCLYVFGLSLYNYEARVTAIRLSVGTKLRLK